MLTPLVYSDDMGYIMHMKTFSDSSLDIASTVSLVLSASMNDADAYYDATEDLVQAFGKKKIASGVYRAVIILPDAVVKFSLIHGRQEHLLKEAAYIQKMREDEKYARHFPETRVVRVGAAPVLLQERVKRIGLISWELHEEVEKLADKFGIDDVHEENYGWAGPKGKEYPVFIDVDFRKKRRRGIRRSWCV